MPLVGTRVFSGGPWEAPIGYARAAVVPPDAGARVIVSGSTSTVDGVVRHPGDAYRQALAALDVVAAALGEVGCSLDEVVRTRMYVVGRENCDAVGRAHGERLAAARPASTMVLVAGLIDEAMLVEIEAEAVVPGAAERGATGVSRP